MFITLEFFLCDKKFRTEFLFLIVADKPILLQFGEIVSSLERLRDNKSPLLELTKL
jgi:hypothetical protein